MTSLDKKPVLTVNGLTRAFGGHVVLDGIDLELYKGQVVLLHGQNGSGKTTLINILTGNLEPDSGEIKINIDGNKDHFVFPRAWYQTFNVFEHFSPERLAWVNLGRSWQESRLFSTQTLENNLAAAKLNQMGESPFAALFKRKRVNADERQNIKEVDGLLESVALEERKDSSADMVSLGQAKRIAILRAVRAGAKVLFLDEPLSGLDLDGIKQVLNLLRRLVEDVHITLVIVEHALNIPWVLKMVSTIWTLADGKLKVTPYETAVHDFASDTSADIIRWLEQTIGAKGEVVTRELPGGALFTTGTPENTENNDIVLKMNDLVVSRGNRRVIGWEDASGSLRGLDFTLRRGHISILHAPNGWGKSTLLEAITGIIPIKSGRVEVNGKTYDRVHEIADAGVTFLKSQDILFGNLTVGENITLSKVDDFEPRIKKNRKADSLSGGEKRTIAWDIVSRRDSDVLLLDEPFSSLDKESVDNVLEKIGSMKNRAVLICIPRALELKAEG